MKTSGGTREMRAIAIERPGDPEVLTLVRRLVRDPDPDEVRVQVLAAGVNRADLIQRRGRYPAPAGWPADIPGLEYAGEIERVGEGVASRRIGERVMGIVGGGGYAEYVVVPEAEVLPIPDGMTFEEAAAVPEVFITADDALFERLGLAAGERLLIHAVGSGVGTAALQLARSVGATVLGTSRSQDKLESARGLGLDLAIDARRESFDEAALAATEGEGVDAVLDLVGGEYVARDLRCLARKGRIAVVGLVAGSSAEVDLGILLRKRLTIIGTSLRTRATEERAAAARAFERRVLPLLQEGRVRPVVDTVLPFENAADAHRLMESNANFGKIVLAWRD